MDAIELLEEQHREVEDLFEEIAEAEADEKREIFEEIADQLAIHATIEERHFYPAVRDASTDEILRRSVEEHLAVKRLITEILDQRASDEELEAKIKLLEEEVEKHVEEEETQLFPKVRTLLDTAALAALAQQMIATQDSLLEAGQPRDRVKQEIGQPASLR
jgi:hemerythrin superfamily protein